MVEPVTVGALVAGALSAGAATLATGMLSEVAKDAYTKLKAAVAKWAGHDVESLEENPESEHREALIAEVVDTRGDDEKRDLAALAQALVAALSEAGKARAETRITVIATHGGMAAGRDQVVNFAAPPIPDGKKGG